MPVNALLALQATTPEPSPLVGLIILAVIVLMIVAMWIVFEKAGEYGWAALIPIYNYLVFARVGGKSMWWGALMLVPIINIVAWFVIAFGVAERFGKSSAFGLGIGILPFIFLPMLAFGDDQATPKYA